MWSINCCCQGSRVIHIRTYQTLLQLFFCCWFFFFFLLFFFFVLFFVVVVVVFLLLLLLFFFFFCIINIPVSILHKFIAGRYRPVRVADGPITARCRFIKYAGWVGNVKYLVVFHDNKHLYFLVLCDY